MNICPKELQLLLEEIDRLRRENAMLREAAGIHISDNEDCDAIQVTPNERRALLRKTV
ncbi:MAG TPA: hypothetical protein GX014_02360 [Firmicutes bacterium]|mgnify:CR=1 FL=1|jgi:hypothetical protein|nr:hypothetical protein [Bacillota bacterium]HHT42232.1 hypothetical protein [Bacillota bacterium]